MSIVRSKFPDQLLVLASSKYFFGKVQTADDLWKVVRTFDCDGVATVYISSVGAFGFIFPDSSPLASIDILRFTGQGSVPQEVMDNDNDIHVLQEKRMLFVNFVSAAFFGRICSKAHKSLVGALYNGQDRVTAFTVIKDEVAIQRTTILDQAVAEKIKVFNTGKHPHYLLNDADIDDAISYIQHLLRRQHDFEYADLQSCMVMNYQAAILHNQQHAAASLALNFSVIESLAREIFMAYGLVGGSTAKSFTTKPHSIVNISRKTFGDMKFYKVIETLRDGGLLDDYMCQRLENTRKKRNDLMHKGVTISPKDSGDCQTLVRDLWALLVDTPFELNAPWSYRR